MTPAIDKANEAWNKLRPFPEEDVPAGAEEAPETEAETLERERLARHAANLKLWPHP